MNSQSYSLAILLLAVLLASAPWLLNKTERYAQTPIRSIQVSPAVSAHWGGAIKGLAPSPQKTPKELQLQLRSPIPQQRLQALRSLGFDSDALSVAMLAQALAQDPCPQVRAFAAQALGTHGDSEEAVIALAQALHDSAKPVRDKALSALASIRNGSVERELQALLAARTLPAETARDVGEFLSRYYGH
jgi:HEAT repeat protein